jgi:hypothetical protein
MSRADYREQAQALLESWPPMPVEIAVHVGRLLADGVVCDAA